MVQSVIIRPVFSSAIFKHVSFFTKLCCNHHLSSDVSKRSHSTCNLTHKCYNYKTNVTRSDVRLHRRLLCQTIDSHPNFYFPPTATRQTREEILANFSVDLDFVTPEEENELLKETDRHLQRLRYQFDHWDDAIEGYRETEVSRWSRGSSAALERLRARAFGREARGVLVHTHVLDLAPQGYIKPHVDSVRFCGSTIAGLSLHSDAVMRLTKQELPHQTVDVFLPARSLYIMKDAARYLYAHEVLKEATFRGRVVEKRRRVSVISRNTPGPKDA
ncbi:alpha-ketoglutarate-dependent dioxygenase alkB homolog 7, mitochondrial [Hyalella azteca]|uniref:Alpha-ketoglutarate-dependent dioxygenase alkB homolog 7, mitochondrial n=1 Tax=Hyalella azteca TaxID=294128 RepID=A0A8B7NTX1_HYAAZ|nr:alpha-ketoglutarate-dependent dioxygenase alkB homolog 7, mitochondrial [Hyalella azteca]